MSLQPLTSTPTQEKNPAHLSAGLLRNQSCFGQPFFPADKQQPGVNVVLMNVAMETKVKAQCTTEALVCRDHCCKDRGSKTPHQVTRAVTGYVMYEAETTSETDGKHPSEGRHSRLKLSPISPCFNLFI